jgi:hypothetical protein
MAEATGINSISLTAVGLALRLLLSAANCSKLRLSSIPKNLPLASVRAIGLFEERPAVWRFGRAGVFSSSVCRYCQNSLTLRAAGNALTGSIAIGLSDKGCCPSFVRSAAQAQRLRR